MKEKKEKREMCEHNGQKFVREFCMGHPRKRKVKVAKKDGAIQL